MKRILILCMFGLCVMFAYAQQKVQQKDVTTFLGIPVDGTKAAMRQKLIQKGFVSKRTSDGTEYFEGEFNGVDVEIYIVTNNNKVWRLYLADVNERSEIDIRLRFNKLISQFENNKRYVSYDNETELISENEDISYEMTVHNKLYDAYFHQIGDFDKQKKEAYNKLVSKYGIEDIKKLSDKELEYLYQEYIEDAVQMKLVWFRIYGNLGNYHIGMYYDNKYNQPNGEDL